MRHAVVSDVGDVVWQVGGWHLKVSACEHPSDRAAGATASGASDVLAIHRVVPVAPRLGLRVGPEAAFDTGGAAQVAGVVEVGRVRGERR